MTQKFSSNKNFINSFRKVLSVYRFSNWYYYIGFVLMGFLIGSPIAMFNGLIVLTHILLICFLLAYAYSFNDFNDKFHKRKFFLAPLLLTFLILLSFKISQIVVSIFFLLIVTLYSSKYIRLKAKPFVCTVCNSLGFSLIFLIGYLHASQIDFSGFLFMLLFFSFNTVAQLIHELVHMKEDRKTTITTAIFLGIKKVKVFSIIFLLLAQIVSICLFYLHLVNMIFLITTTIFTTFFIIKIYKENKINEEFRKKYRNFGIIAGLIYLLNFLIL